VQQDSIVKEVLSRSPEGSFCIIETESAQPEWLSVFVRDEIFYRVSGFSFVYVCEQDVECAARLSHIGDLNFFMTSVTDQDLAPFRQAQFHVGALGFAHKADWRITDCGPNSSPGRKGGFPVGRGKGQAYTSSYERNPRY
jgi:hypothetical protein